MKQEQFSTLEIERYRLLIRVEKLTETPLVVLGFVWIMLLVMELLNKSSNLLQSAGIFIWVLFIIDFFIKFFLSPRKVRFLKKNILTIISLMIPAFRIFRLFRIIKLLRFSKSLRLLSVIGSLNRGMKALSVVIKQRGFGYVFVFTVIVSFVGSAGMYAFEKNINPGFDNFWSSLWWTTMLVMSIGTENWPKTTEGRILSFLIGLYGLAVFGYITATIATFFINKENLKK